MCRIKAFLFLIMVFPSFAFSVEKNNGTLVGLAVDCKHENGRVEKINFVLRNVSDGSNPMIAESKRIASENGCKVSQDSIDGLGKLSKIAKDNNVNYLALVDYAYGISSENDRNIKYYDIPKPVQKVIERANLGSHSLDKDGLKELQQCLDEYTWRYGSFHTEVTGKYDWNTKVSVHWFADNFCVNLNGMNLIRVNASCSVGVPVMELSDSLYGMIKKEELTEDDISNLEGIVNNNIRSFQMETKMTYSESQKRALESLSDKQRKLLENSPTLKLIYGENCGAKLKRNKNL